MARRLAIAPADDAVKAANGYVSIWWNKPDEYKPQNVGDNFVAFQKHPGVDSGRCGAQALAEVSDDRLDRLYAAKAYLQTDVATAEGEVMQEINNEIANEEVDAARLRHSARDTEKGQTHG